MNILRKSSLTLLSLLMVFSIFGCQKEAVDVKKQQKEFTAFIEKEFVSSMEDDYISTHNYLEHPENYGIDKEKIEVWIDAPYTDKQFKENRKELKQKEKEFKAFDRESLTKQQRKTYDLYEKDLESSILGFNDKFEYLGNPFSTISGIHTQLPILFSDFVVRNEEDAKDLIKLVNSSEEYIKGIIKYVNKQAKKGLLMMDLEGVKTYSQKIIEAKENSFVLQAMNASIDALSLDSTQANTYKEQLQDAFMNSFIPAYQLIIDTCDALKTEKNNTQGLKKLKNGKEYYEYLFKMAVGSERSIKDTKKLLRDLAHQNLLTISKIANENKNVFNQWAKGLYKTEYTSFDSMLNDLESDIQKDFPKVSKNDFMVGPLNTEIANDGVAAYFNIPAIDGTTPKQIKVNTNESLLDIQSLETFNTVAHEGFPGHLYSTAYFYENLPSPYHKILVNNIGFDEGYATYVGFYAFNYLKDIDKDAIKLQEAMSVYQNCIVALMDIGIHYDGWDMNEAKEFMIENGLDSSSAKALYNQLQDNPTSFLSYYVGYGEIITMKQEAKKELGEKFDEKQFHTALLKNGSVPFSVVQKEIDAYVKREK